MINENDYNQIGGGVITMPEPTMQCTGGGEHNKQSLYSFHRRCHPTWTQVSLITLLMGLLLLCIRERVYNPSPTTFPTCYVLCVVSVMSVSCFDRNSVHLCSVFLSSPVSSQFFCSLFVVGLFLPAFLPWIKFYFVPRVGSLYLGSPSSAKLDSGQQTSLGRIQSSDVFVEIFNRNYNMQLYTNFSNLVCIITSQYERNCIHCPWT